MNLTNIEKGIKVAFPNRKVTTSLMFDVPDPKIVFTLAGRHHVLYSIDQLSRMGPGHLLTLTVAELNNLLRDAG